MTARWMWITTTNANRTPLEEGWRFVLDKIRATGIIYKWQQRCKVNLLDNLPRTVAASIASVAQLDRASVYGTGGCRFESCQARFVFVDDRG